MEHEYCQGVILFIMFFQCQDNFLKDWFMEIIGYSYIFSYQITHFSSFLITEITIYLFKHIMGLTLFILADI